MDVLRAVWLGLMLVVFAPGGAARGQQAGGEFGRRLMPWPAAIEAEPGRLPLARRWHVRWRGEVEPRLERAAGRLLAEWARFSGMTMEQVAEADGATLLEIDCRLRGVPVQPIVADERYRLRIGAAGISLKAETPLGVLRGLATLAQLADLDTEGFYLPAARIDDRPRFGWRGLLIDVCRHWQPIEVILRNLDGMAAVKLNVLHLHLTEDQGFRIESKAYPRLHKSGSDGRYFTQAEIERIIVYARDRGIRVVPEFDMPGHTASWLVGHPELAAGPGPYAIARHWGVFDACLDPTREATYTFLDRFLGEMAGLFADPTLHIGGDEVNGVWWRDNADIQAFMRQRGMDDVHDLQAHFNRRVAAILARHGKWMIGWDEILHDDLPRDAIVQSWRGAEGLVRAASAGHGVILSHGYYLDHMRPAAYHYGVDPLPDDVGLDAAALARVLGGEACMWGEYVTPETIDSRVWPRLAAIAERLWSPSAVRDVDGMYRRLAQVERQLDGMGLLHRANRPRMLRRLTGGREIAALRVLADVVEPVKFYGRSKARRYHSADPLNRLVDAVRPESAAARAFGRAVDDYLARPDDGALRDMVGAYLAAWRGHRAALAPIIASSSLLAEVEPISRDLAELGRVGGDAVAMLSDDRSPTEAWRDEAARLIERCREPRAELEVAIVPAMQRLIEAAAALMGEPRDDARP